MLAWSVRDQIMNAFIIQKNHTLVSLFQYIHKRYNKDIKLNDIRVEMLKLVKNSYIILKDNEYTLTETGNIIVNNQVYYYSVVIQKFFKKCITIKRFQLKEIREEQRLLRKFLIENKEQKCVICNKTLPLCLLDTAHLKPRCLINHSEKYDTNIVEFMCKYCHTLYDNGFIANRNGFLNISTYLANFDLNYVENTLIQCYNQTNQKYFDFHYKNIYKG